VPSWFYRSAVRWSKNMMNCSWMGSLVAQ
jgi:hypothetical protein